MPDVVSELLLADAAVEKLGTRDISGSEVGQLPGNRHVIGPNPRGGEERRLLVGFADGGRALTLIVERTLDPTTWQVVTGWTATRRERKMLESGS